MLTFLTFNGPDCNYRVIAARPILIKAQNDLMRKTVALDMFVNLPFAFEISKSVSTKTIKIEKRFLATLKVYTLRKVGA